MERVLALMEKYGSIEYAKACAYGLAGAAQHEFEAISSQLKPGRDRDFLGGLPTWVFERT